MSATYVLQALQKVNAAIDEVQAARVTPALTPDQYSALTDAYFALDGVHDDLLADDINSQLDAITKDAQKLQQTVTDLKVAADKIKSVIDAVDTATQVVGTVLQILKLGATIV